MDQPCMYIFVNSDLKMSKGRVAAQCGHIVGIVIEKLVRMGYEIYPPPKEYYDFVKWKNNCTKIVLKATTEELLEMSKLDGTYYFEDSNERFHGNDKVMTCVTFNPGNGSVFDFVGNYKLL